MKSLMTSMLIALFFLSGMSAMAETKEERVLAELKSIDQEIVDLQAVRSDAVAQAQARAEQAKVDPTFYGDIGDDLSDVDAKIEIAQEKRDQRRLKLLVELARARKFRAGYSLTHFQGFIGGGTEPVTLHYILGHEDRYRDPSAVQKAIRAQVLKNSKSMAKRHVYVVLNGAGGIGIAGQVIKDLRESQQIPADVKIVNVISSELALEAKNMSHAFDHHLLVNGDPLAVTRDLALHPLANVEEVDVHVIGGDKRVSQWVFANLAKAEIDEELAKKFVSLELSTGHRSINSSQTADAAQILQDGYIAETKQLGHQMMFAGKPRLFRPMKFFTSIAGREYLRHVSKETLQALNDSFAELRAQSKVELWRIRRAAVVGTIDAVQETLRRTGIQFAISKLLTTLRVYEAFEKIHTAILNILEPAIYTAAVVEEQFKKATERTQGLYDALSKHPPFNKILRPRLTCEQLLSNI